MNKYEDFNKYFETMMIPQTKPYHIFVDDTVRHFKFKGALKVLGLLSPSSEKTPDEIPVLTRKAFKEWDLSSSYDAQSGIPASAFHFMIKFAKNNKKDIDSIVLDWDKTLTMHSSFKTTKINKAIMEGYFGGKHRMNKIRLFFKSMKKNKVNVRILTSNPRSKYDLDSFKKGLKYVSGEWVPIYYTENVKTWYIHKNC